MSKSLSSRRLLAAVAATGLALVSLSGCTTPEGPPHGPTTSTPGTTPTPTPTPTRPSSTVAPAPSGFELAAPRLEKVATFKIQVGPPVEMGVTGKGKRRIIPITSGTAEGLINGRIMPSGSDVQVIRPDNVAEIVASYGIETTRGTHVFIHNPGVRHAPPEVFERLNRGEIVDPNLVYFRTTPRIETDDPELKWMENDIFVASGARYPDRVQIDVYHVT